MRKQEIVFEGIEFIVEFDYQPFEPAETGVEAQYPGCEESIEGVYSMQHKGTDFFDLLYDTNENKINELILEAIHDAE